MHTDGAIESVQFHSDGLTLSGDLRRPPDGAGGSRPALVFTGPFTGVKEQVVGLYAERLARAGYVTLAFDHRNFGASEGMPRQHESGAGKLSDLRDATSFLASVDGVDPDRLGCVGICLGGGYALRHAAFDPRIKALVTIAGAYNDPRVMRGHFGEANYRSALATYAEIAARQQATGEVEYMPAVAVSGEAAMGGQEPFDYYGTERSAAATWENRVTVLSLRELITVDNGSGAEFISPTPWCVIHGRRDDFCSPDDASGAFERAAEPKVFHWLDTTNHIDLYDNPDFTEPATTLAVDWLRRHLD
jgi:fermentation-respiration switch protein FrsA (DUF1100 family)